MVLWALFFSAIFLVFAFRGLIATSFMKKIDVSEPSANLEEIVTGIEENRIEEPAVSQEGSSPPVQSGADTYIVQPNDTLYGIGLTLDKDWGAIAQLNDIEPPYSLSVGQVLKLP